jgi:phosphoribosylanthranilate isomerase
VIVPKVKICGVTSAEDARVAFALGAHAIGLNFHPASPRVVSQREARAIVESVGPGRCIVGVFVNRPRQEVAATAREVGLSAVQFHGDETPEYCAGWEPLVVIKAVRASGPAAGLAARAARYEVAYVLVDAPGAGYGGGGRTFSWEVASGVPRERLIVAGGLTPENVADAVRMLRPAGVDVASGVEERPGRKSHGKIEAFIAAATAA